MPAEAHAETIVDAPAERVWQCFLAFDAYPAWNPFLLRVEGEPELGARLRVRFRPPGAPALNVSPRVVAFEPGRELAWRGGLPVPGIFDAEHSMRVEPLGAKRAHFVQRERYSGLLAPLLAGAVAARVTRGFSAALKARVERSAGAGNR